MQFKTVQKGYRHQKDMLKQMTVMIQCEIAFFIENCDEIDRNCDGDPIGCDRCFEMVCRQ